MTQRARGKNIRGFESRKIFRRELIGEFFANLSQNTLSMDEQGTSEMQKPDEVAGPGTPPRFVWSPELTSAFISLRSTHEELFTKRRNSASHGYSIILQKLTETGLIEDNTLTPRQLRKKWENLLKRYRKMKHAVNAGLASGYSGSEGSYEAWPHYKDMDQILSKPEPLSHMLLSEPISGEGFDYDEDYQVCAKRFRSDCEDGPPIEVVETSTQTKAMGTNLRASNAYQPGTSCQVKPECDSSTVVISRSEVLQQLLVLHERFISLYERLVIALENSTD